MRLICLHGAPASGKLTTAKALVARTNGRLFDNHASIDIARTLFEFGAPGFWELVRAVRLVALDAAGRANLPLVVMTFAYVAPDDEARLQEFEECMNRHGGQLLPVFLRCSDDELLRRIGNPDRVAKRKLTSAEGLKQSLAEEQFEPVPRASCLHLDSEANDAETNASKIIAHFGLLTSICEL
jgi:hypothetical protein